MITLGIVLIMLGWLVKGLAVLQTIGYFLLVVGVILWILGAMGRAVGGASTTTDSDEPRPIRSGLIDIQHSCTHALMHSFTQRMLQPFR